MAIQKIKTTFLDIWEYICYLPLLTKSIVSLSRAYLYLRRGVIKQGLLTKVEADNLFDKALKNTYEKDLEKYADTETFGQYAIRVELLSWIRKYGNQKSSIDKFCDEEMLVIDNWLEEGDLMYRIKASDYTVIVGHISEYKKLQEEISLSLENSRVLH